MTITQQTEGKTILLFPEGRLDTTAAPELDRVLEGLEPCEKLILDLEKVTYISSSGLRVLLSREKAVSQKGPMILRHVPDCVMEVFTITGFSGFLTIE